MSIAVSQDELARQTRPAVLTVRVAPELYRRFADLAWHERTSMNALVVEMIREAVTRHERSRGQ